jgi:hypothetical protein
MPFLDPVRVQQRTDTRWATLGDLRYQAEWECFVVPAGFVTDFASVPRIFTWLIPRYGRYTKSAILHDFLVSLSRVGRFDRYDADGIFRRTMREADVPVARRWVMWAAVRLGAGPRSLLTAGLGQLLGVLAIFLVMLVLLAVPAVSTLIVLGILWLVEAAIWLALKILPTRDPVDAPSYFGPLRRG